MEANRSISVRFKVVLRFACQKIKSTNLWSKHYAKTKTWNWNDEMGAHCWSFTKIYFQLAMLCIFGWVEALRWDSIRTKSISLSRINALSTVLFHVFIEYLLANASLTELFLGGQHPTHKELGGKKTVIAIRIHKAQAILYFDSFIFTFTYTMFLYQ